MTGIEDIDLSSLSETAARKELEKLGNEIRRHDNLYYLEDEPILTDSEYDLLRRRHALIEAAFPNLIRPDSPSLRVGAPPGDGFTKVSHSQPMLSLDNAFSREDVIAFISKIRRFVGVEKGLVVELLAEPKIDGLSASLRYEDGLFVRGATRGDGFTGEDVTANLKTIIDIPKRLKGDLRSTVVEIRGEVYIGREDFVALNDERELLGETKFANPRNAAAGGLRQLDPEVTRNRRLRFFAYGYGDLKKDGAELYLGSTLVEVREKLEEWGFVLNKPIRLSGKIDELLDFYQGIVQQRWTLPMDLDGVVYKVNDLALQSRLGSISRSPRWAIAHKFPAEQAITVVDEIIIQVGRTGALTPVAVLKPVNVGGVVISRATLHNEEEIIRKDIRQGDTIVIQRAGDVIPQVVKVDLDLRKSQAKRYVFPSSCPVCGSKALRNEGEAVWRCSGGMVCSAQAIERLCHFVGRDAFDIEGIGEKQMQDFWSCGLVRVPSDLFKLDRAKKEMVLRDGWGEMSVTNLLSAIERRRHVPLDRFIYALGIRMVGQMTAKLLAQAYQNFPSFDKAMREAQRESSVAKGALIGIDGIGPKVASELLVFFANDYNLNLVASLLGEITIEPYGKINSNSAMAGKVVVFSGALQNMTRSEAKAQAQSVGALVAGSISRKTDYLIVGTGSGAKAGKAKELGVEIITEDQWKKMLKS